jgi:uncharacterized protein YegL
MNTDGKIQQLNNAIREALPEMKKVADENPNAEVMVRALKFSSGAQWINPSPVPVDTYTWADLDADGVTDMGIAFEMVAEQLKMPPMPERALPPVLVLISDGQPTDDWKSGIKKILDQPWGMKAVRISIGIGGDADISALQEFIHNSELKPLTAKNPEALVKYIKWVSTAVVKSASAPASKTGESKQPTGNVEIPQVPSAPQNVDDVW